jgi:hypothetical protein
MFPYFFQKLQREICTRFGKIQLRTARGPLAASPVKPPLDITKILYIIQLCLMGDSHGIILFPFRLLIRGAGRDF